MGKNTSVTTDFHINSVVRNNEQFYIGIRMCEIFYKYINSILFKSLVPQNLWTCQPLSLIMSVKASPLSACVTPFVLPYIISWRAHCSCNTSPLLWFPPGEVGFPSSYFLHTCATCEYLLPSNSPTEPPASLPAHQHSQEHATLRYVENDLFTEAVRTLWDSFFFTFRTVNCWLQVS